MIMGDTVNYKSHGISDNENNKLNGKDRSAKPSAVLYRFPSNLLQTNHHK